MATYGTIGFYEELADRLNHDPGWADQGKAISCTMSFTWDEPVGKRFLMRFNAGHVDEVRELDLDDDAPSDFVFTGSPEMWRRVLTNQISPAQAIMGNKIKMQGKKSWLLQNMMPFKHVLATLTSIDEDVS